MTGNAEPGRRPRRIATAVVAGVGLALAAAAGAIAPWSPSGWAVLGAAALATAALVVARVRARRTLRALAAVTVMVMVGARIAAVSRSATAMVTLPGGASSRWLGRLLDEQDVSLLGARLLVARGRLPADERAGLVGAMHGAYVEMRAEAGTSPSPVLDTLLGRQRPDAFDALVLEPPGAHADAAVVFLHGYGGSFTLECWLVAVAARAIDAVTVCPATGFAGHWGGPDGERTVRATLDALRARGVRRVFLAGLSNGASGASALAPRLASSLAGLVLISGAPAGGSTGGLPTLVVQGERDGSAAGAHAFVARTYASYAGFDGGHFVLLMRRREAQGAIARWLTAASATHRARARTPPPR